MPAGASIRLRAALVALGALAALGACAGRPAPPAPAASEPGPAEAPASASGATAPQPLPPGTRFGCIGPPWQALASTREHIFRISHSRLFIVPKEAASAPRARLPPVDLEQGVVRIQSTLAGPDAFYLVDPGRAGCCAPGDSPCRVAPGEVCFAPGGVWAVQKPNFELKKIFSSDQQPYRAFPRGDSLLVALKEPAQVVQFTPPSTQVTLVSGWKDLAFLRASQAQIAGGTPSEVLLFEKGVSSKIKLSGTLEELFFLGEDLFCVVRSEGAARLLGVTRGGGLFEVGALLPAGRSFAVAAQDEREVWLQSGHLVSRKAPTLLQPPTGPLEAWMAQRARVVGAGAGQVYLQDAAGCLVSLPR